MYGYWATEGKFKLWVSTPAEAAASHLSLYCGTDEDEARCQYHNALLLLGPDVSCPTFREMWGSVTGS